MKDWKIYAAVLLAFGAVGLAALAFAVEDGRDEMRDPPTPTRASEEIDVLVEVVFPTPVPTATETPMPETTDSPDPTRIDYCGSVPSYEGQVCRMPMPTATATATLPACWSAEAEDGQFCEVRGTGTPSGKDV